MLHWHALRHSRDTVEMWNGGDASARQAGECRRLASVKLSGEEDGIRQHAG